MMKKWTSLTAALVLVLSFAACGSTDAVPTAASVSQSISSSSAEPESNSTESEITSESTSESIPASTSASEATSASATAANSVTGIELSSTGGLLYVGYSASAKVYTVPYEAPAANAAEVTYTSSDESVVTVTPNTTGAAGFTVQGAAPGTATVTVEYKGYTAEYSVTVQKYVAPVKTSTNTSQNSGSYKSSGSAGTNAGASAPAAQAPAQTAPVTQAPAATAPTPTPAPTPAPAPTTPPAQSEPNIVYGPKPDGSPIADDELIGGNGFDWGAVNGGDAVYTPRTAPTA